MRTYGEDMDRGAARVINPDRCKACTACQKACPSGAVIRTGKKTVSIAADMCTGCGQCERACKFGAIGVLQERPERSVPPPILKEDFYQKLRRSISSWLESEQGARFRWAKYLMLAPDLFHEMCRLLADGDVPLGEKAKLSLAITYFILPVDVCPEAIMGPVGYLDDVALAAYILHSLLNKVEAKVVMRHWAGDADLLQSLRNVLADVENMVSTGMWRSLKKVIF